MKNYKFHNFYGTSFTQLSMKHINVLLCYFIILTTKFIEIKYFPAIRSFHAFHIRGIWCSINYI